MVFPACPGIWQIWIFAVSLSRKFGKILEFLKIKNWPAGLARREKGCY